MSASEQPAVLFVADAHFHLEPDATEQRRVARFLDFLQMAEQADDLVLLGDIFDFWFDYPHFRLKDYDGILSGLDAVRDAGTRLHFVGGNHDIWAADYLHRRYGSSPDGERRIIRFGAQRVLLDHGDGLLGRDRAYAAFRAVVRHRLGVLSAKSLHPEVLFALSTWLSGRSRSATRDEAVSIVDKAKRWLERQDGAAWDLMIMGHVHHAFELTDGPRRMAALAGWLDTLGYGLLRDGRFRLLDFAVDTDPLT
ncbi:MAG: UDP-2,3-diacylglucosamine diphosphatase [bacterium]|nr:UDP-2,3-diacylglucosamine diphosphatase [bacterium]